MKYVYLMLSWTSGIILISVGLLTIVSSPLASLTLLVGSLFLLPPSRDFCYSLTKISLTPKFRSIVIISLLVAFPILLNQSIERERLARIAQEDADRTKKAQQIKDDNIAFFNANREQIISEAQSALTNSDYQLAINISQKYLTSDDSKLIEINKLATEYLRAINEAEHFAKKEEQRKARVNDLLARLSTVPEGDIKQLREIYQELTRHDPDNTNYQEQLVSYSKKYKEIEVQQEQARKEQEAKAEFDKSKRIIEAIESRYQENAKTLGKYYANTDQIKNGNTDILQLELVIVTHKNANDKQAKALAAKAGTLKYKVAQQVRQMYASSVEEIFMKTGIDARVSAIGSEKRQLKISYALMSQPLVYKFQNEIKISDQARTLGFSSIVYTNGFDSSLGKTWTVEISKK